jgi:hypothetical protein
VVRQGHLIAIVRAFLIVCAVVLAVGCAGVRSGAPQEEQEHTEATKEQGRSPEATASEEARCGRTKTIDLMGSASASASEPAVVDSSVKPGDPEARFVTNDVPGCPNKGGLLSGTDKGDQLAGEDGEDEVRGLGASDKLSGGRGSDVVYGGPGGDELQAGGMQPLSFYSDRSNNVLHGGPGRDFLAGEEGDDVLYGGDGDDEMLWGGGGEDVLYGGDGNDWLDDSEDGHQDKLYCGEGKDQYLADKIDYVDSSCEVNAR